MKLCLKEAIIEVFLNFNYTEVFSKLQKSIP